MKTIVIIGGGAAGYFCAVNAARRLGTAQVMILEKSGKTLSKVKVSGGGRCNVTHEQFNILELLKNYPRGKNFLKKELFQFGPAETMKWFEARGVELKTEKDGRVFPVSNKSQSIIDCLKKEAKSYGVVVRLHSAVENIRPESGKWRLKLQGDAEPVMADYICVACGGFPKMQQFDWLTNLGHQITPPVPSLFTFNLGKHPITALMGVSIDHATIRVNGTKLAASGPLLITHWGLSGPAVLRLSAWGAQELAANQYQFTIQVNWLGTQREQALRENWNDIREQQGGLAMGDKNPFQLPKRLWAYLLDSSEITHEMIWSRLPGKLQNKLIQRLVADTYSVSGKTTFKEEFVTCGGVDLAAVNPLTMESRLHPGLYFAGEVLNIDGITGGFNFQHAWASGWVAAKDMEHKEVQP